MIHVFECQDWTLVNTLNEHASAVTAVCFSPCGRKLLSCGADRAVVFRTVTNPKDCTVVVDHMEQLPCSKAGQGGVGGGAVQAVRSPAAAPHPAAVDAGFGVAGGAGSGAGVLYDLAIDASGRLVVTAGQDGALRLFDVDSGRQIGLVQQEESGGKGNAVEGTEGRNGGLGSPLQQAVRSN